MRCRHDMPFGAEIRDEGVRFRLWAPAARQVEVALEGAESLSMSPQEGGWFELVTGRAAPGSLYRFRLDGGASVPDPASRFNPMDVHGPSQVVDPLAFQWRDEGWRGRPWEEAVIYELHVGAFSPAGTFAGVADRLEYLADLGVTAIELMPVADFPGARNWGYDGALPFAPDSRYGRPDDLKALVQAAHGKGLMVLLDVVCNHFGPEGNYLHLYAPQFFTERHATPWGAAIDFDGPASRAVRDFFVHNALYWLEEFRLDGLRLDAVHAIWDDSAPDILEEIADAVSRGPGRERRIHLVLENDRNAARYLGRTPGGGPRWYTAQWNDDFHHALHLLLTGEADGYYTDYADRPVRHLGRCLAEGFAYQGEPSAYRHGRPRGEPSGHLPPTAFVNFLQTHDQIGNRAFGERLSVLARPEALRAAVAILLLAPSPPLLFMGEEWAARSPFLFFCDFEPGLAADVTEGRRKEFARFGRFADPAARRRIPDPNAPDTFQRSRLDWDALTRPGHRDWLALYRQLLALRRAEIVPRLKGMEGGRGTYEPVGRTGLVVRWGLGDGSRLTLCASLGDAAVGQFPAAPGEPLYATGSWTPPETMPPWTVAWYLARAGGEATP